MPNAFTRTFNAIGGSLMARSGRVGILGSTGAKTGKARRVPLGYALRPDGSVLIGCGSPEHRGWTANLRATPGCTFSIRGTERRYLARLVIPEQRAAALAELTSTVGAVAERVTWGDLFVLEPAGVIPHQFRAANDGRRTTVATGGTDAGAGSMHVITVDDAGARVRCEVAGCGRHRDDPLHEVE